MCMALFYPTIKVAILQLRGAVEKIWKKDRLKITEGRNKKRILEEKESKTEKSDFLCCKNNFETLAAFFF